MTQFRFKNFLNLIRALFPRWSFFDRIGHHFELEFKVQNSRDWQKISFDQDRKAFSLFVNPAVNLAMAQVNIIEHFMGEISDLQRINSEVDSKDVQDLTTFRLLRSLIEVKLEAFEIPAGPFQFKILACSPEEKLDVYISDWLSGSPS